MREQDKTRTQFDGNLKREDSIYMINRKREETCSIHKNFIQVIRANYRRLLQGIKTLNINQRKSKTSHLPLFSPKVMFQLGGIIFQSLVSLMLIVDYIIFTYFPENPKDIPDVNTRTFIQILLIVDLILGIIITVRLIVFFILSNHKPTFFFDRTRIIDILTIIPIYVDFILPNQIAFIRLFRMLRLLRIIRIFYILKRKHGIDTIYSYKKEVTREIVISILRLISSLLLLSGILHYLNNQFYQVFDFHIGTSSVICSQTGQEPDFNFSLDSTGVSYSSKCAYGDTLSISGNKLTFDIAFYFIVITIVTLGYGDIYPTSVYSRIIIIAILFFMCVIISRLTEEIKSAINSRFFHYSQRYKSKYDGDHIILSGYVTKESLQKFIIEFYHENQVPRYKLNQMAVNIVIVQNQTPDIEIEALLDGKFDEKLFYIIGDLTEMKIQRMADVKNAKACFLLSSWKSDNDKSLLLFSKALSQNYDVNIFIQFTKSKFSNMQWFDWNHAFSTVQMKYTTIVKNSLITGFSTLIMNLCCTTSSNYARRSCEKPWVLEYLQSTYQEIYLVKILPNDKRINKDYKEIVKYTYSQYGVLVIGVRKKMIYENNSEIYYFHCLLNPYKYNISVDDELIVLADDGENLKDLSYEENHLENNDTNNVNSPISMASFKYVNRGLKSIIDEDFRLYFEKRKSFSFNMARDRYDLSALLDNHFVLFCNIKSLFEFLPIFYSFYNEYIFFITNPIWNKKEEKEISKKLDQLRKDYPKIIKVECGYSRRDELRLLNLESARHIFVLSFMDSVTHTLDSGVLNLLKIIEEDFNKCKITIELIQEENIKFIEDNIHISNCPKKAVNNNLSNKIPRTIWPKYSQSQVFLSSCLDYLLPYAFYKPGIIEVLGKILGLEASCHDVVKENSSFSMMKYIGKEPAYFKEVFELFLELDVICIGVYRMSAELQNDIQYLIMNPRKDLTIYQTDLLICIGMTDKLDGDDFNIFHKMKSVEPLHRRYTDFEEKHNHSILSDLMKKEGLLLFEPEEQLTKDAFFEELQKDVNRLLKKFASNIIDDPQMLSGNELNKKKFTVKSERIKLKYNALE